MKAAVKEKMRCFKKWMKTRNVIDRETYVNARNRAEEVKRKSKNESWIKIGEDLLQDVHGTKKLLYCMAKNYKRGNTAAVYSVADRDGQNLLVEEEEVAGRWKKYFEELLNIEEETGEVIDIVERGQVEHPEEEEITVDEVKLALKLMKNGKASGEDGLPVEILKAGGENTVEWLTRLFNTAYREEKVPEDWQQALICPIHKNKAARTECANYRGVSLLSHTGKLYERIIEHRIRRVIETKVNNCLYGFRPGRSTTDPVFAMKMLLEKSWEWDRSKYIVFVDLEKAFDRINRNRLWNVLEDDYYGISTKLVKVVKSVYENCQSRVKCGEIEGNWSEVRTGVRQGGVLSPLLFIIYMDKCLREVVQPAGEETFVYADDVAVVTDSPDGLQFTVDRWQEGMIRNGMKINKRKSEVMAVTRNLAQLEIYCEGERLTETENFQYLGINLNKRNLNENEINKRIRKYNASVSTLYPLLKDKHVPIKCKVIIFNTILKPILLYGAECWTLTTKQESKIQAAEMRVLRLIRGVTRRDRMRNVQIREDLGVRPVLEEMDRARLRWSGHVMRMEEDRQAKKFMNWIPRGKRPSGRHRNSWKEGVQERLKRRGKDMDEVTENREYADRDGWRRIVQMRRRW